MKWLTHISQAPSFDFEKLICYISYLVFASGLHLSAEIEMYLGLYKVRDDFQNNFYSSHLKIALPHVYCSDSNLGEKDTIS